MQEIYRADGDQLIGFLHGRLPHPPECYGPGSIVADDEGAVQAAWMFEPSVRGAFDLSLAADDPKWALRGTIASLFQQAFIEIGAKRLMASIGESNKRSFRMARFMGFTPVGLLPRWYDSGEGAWIMDLLAEDCRWLGDDDG